MPDLSSLLQQHVEQLSQSPAAGFAGVRAKALRRTQQRVGAAAVAALVVAGAVLAGTGTFSRSHPAPAHPSPPVTTTGAPKPTPSARVSRQPATLVQTHWRMTSITAFGSTTQLSDEQDYLYMTFQGHFLIREHCANITGGATLAQTIKFTTGLAGSTVVSGSPTCAQQPLAKQITEVLRSPLNNNLKENRLTLVGATGAISFVAEPEIVSPAPLTSRLWQLTRVRTSKGTSDLSSYQGATPDALWLTFGALTGNFFAGVGCDGVQGTAITSGHDLDLAGLLPAPTGGCSAAAKATHTAVTDAYRQLVKDGRVSWTVTGTTLVLRGTTTTLTFTDKGPASRLQGAPASASG
jgi:hypothetical protein